jgi:hypothetical protein
MKMKATIEVEYEAVEGEYRNVVESALMRGVGPLAVASSRAHRPNRNQGRIRHNIDSEEGNYGLTR